MIIALEMQPAVIFKFGFRIIELAGLARRLKIKTLNKQ